MTQSIRDAARTLLDEMYYQGCNSQAKEECEALEAALSAPQPTVDERVAEQQAFEAWCPYSGNPDPRVVWATAWKSARALLSASQEDAEHAAMYRWLRSGIHSLYITTGDLAGDCEDADRVPAGLQGSIADAAIRAAMSAKETK